MSTNTGIKVLGIIIAVLSTLWLLTVYFMFKDAENPLILITVMGAIPVGFVFVIYWVIKELVEKYKKI